MRTILFRGLTFSGEWEEGSLMTLLTGDRYIRSAKHETRFGCGVGVFPESVGEYTGLDDMLGKKVFEGDIVHSDSHNPSRYVVEFVEGGFVCVNEKCAPIEINHFYPSIGCQFKVVGNIHDKKTEAK